MLSVQEMAESHLLNVQREIVALNERKKQIDVDLEKLNQYLEEGVKTMKEAQGNSGVASPQ